MPPTQLWTSPNQQASSRLSRTLGRDKATRVTSPEHAVSLLVGFGCAPMYLQQHGIQMSNITGRQCCMATPSYDHQIFGVHELFNVLQCIHMCLAVNMPRSELILAKLANIRLLKLILSSQRNRSGLPYHDRSHPCLDECSAEIDFPMTTSASSLARPAKVCS